MIDEAPAQLVVRRYASDNWTIRTVARAPLTLQALILMTANKIANLNAY